MKYEQIFYGGHRAGKTSMMHQSNVDQLREYATIDPTVYTVFKMHEEHRISWEYAATALALAQTEALKHANAKVIYLVERMTVPIVFPDGM